MADSKLELSASETTSLELKPFPLVESNHAGGMMGFVTQETTSEASRVHKLNMSIRKGQCLKGNRLLMPSKPIKKGMPLVCL